MNKLLLSSLLLACGTAALSADTVPLTFESAGQFSGSFRVLNQNGATLGQTSNGVANDFMTSANGSGASIVYDANAGTTGISSFSVSQSAPLNVSVDLSFSTSGNSFGIYVINAANEAQGYLALFNVNNSGANDAIRFSTAVVNPGNPSSVGTLAAGSYANNADLGVGPTGTFGGYSFSYSINTNNEAVLSMTAGSQTSTYTIAGSSAFTNVEVGFRLGSSSGTIGLDNLNIASATIPEPSTFAMLAGAAVLTVGLMRRRGVR